MFAYVLATKGDQTYLLALVCDVYCDFVTFPFGILGQVCYLIVSIPDPCCYFLKDKYLNFFMKPMKLIFKERNTNSVPFKFYLKINCNIHHKTQLDIFGLLNFKIGHFY